jgi:hypothetical protein
MTDGLQRDAHPSITRQGRAFSVFDRACGQILRVRRDRPGGIPGGARARRADHCGRGSVCRAADLDAHLQSADGACRPLDNCAGGTEVLLDAFLVRQREYQSELRAAIATDSTLNRKERAEQTILEHFRLLQACDNLSLLACVAFCRRRICCIRCRSMGAGVPRWKCMPIGPRHFRLEPWPFAKPEMSFGFPARHVARQVLCRLKKPGSRVSRDPCGTADGYALRIGKARRKE